MKKCVLLKNISLLQIYIAASKIKEKTLLRNQQLNCTKVIRTEERSELTTNRVVIFFSSSGSGDGGGGGGGQVTAITGATHIETLINPCQQGERKSGRGVFQSPPPPSPSLGSPIFPKYRADSRGDHRRGRLETSRFGRISRREADRSSRRVASRRLPFENSEKRGEVGQSGPAQVAARNFNFRGCI